MKPTLPGSLLSIKQCSVRTVRRILHRQLPKKSKGFGQKRKRCCPASQPNGISFDRQRKLFPHHHRRSQDRGTVLNGSPGSRSAARVWHGSGSKHIAQRTHRKAAILGQAAETDAAQTIKAQRVYPVGQASESDSAQGITYRTAAPVGQVAETDSAQPITARKIKTIGQASETDQAQPIGSSGAIIVNQASEIDLAQPITPRKVKAIGQVVETDSAQL